ncbi:hypothetical protein DP73_21205 [Desulfosporosinus sp. HMP52]|uniref:hypothetical protein n=1 Tax=Desulfosporosinus sp. HMP52 TaxID=1487923 RepID=UPI00051FB5EC|nr:hypothetical protein [Desulfosporosinus sp. HMP52]KGK81787.1 hypothetical protein DP73_21205 [Desulfosporosinus sp. HMP52]
MNVEKIYTSRLPFDVTSWCQEKTDNVVKQLANLIHVTKSSEVGANLDGDINFLLYLALSDATKMMAFAHGANWKGEDVDLIADQGNEGYDKLKFRYGLLDITKKQRSKEELTQIVIKIHEFLSGRVAPNRTFIHELLSTSEYSDPVIDDILNKIEEVTMGNLAWDEFCVYARIRVKDLEDRIEKM